MTINNDNELIETMGLLMLINNQARQGGILTIVPIVDQVKEAFLQKSLQMAIDSYDPESKNLLEDWKERCQRGEVVF